MENSPDTLTRPYLRKLIDFALKTDSEIDAFCIDYFPQIKARFSIGMERLIKLNLLLETIEVDEIYKSLLEYDAHLIQKHAGASKEKSLPNENLINETLTPDLPIKHWFDLPLSILIFSQLECRSELNDQPRAQGHRDLRAIEVNSINDVEQLIKELKPRTDFNVKIINDNSEEIEINVNIQFNSLKEFSINHLITHNFILSSLLARRNTLNEVFMASSKDLQSRKASLALIIPVIRSFKSEHTPQNGLFKTFEPDELFVKCLTTEVSKYDKLLSESSKNNERILLTIETLYFLLNQSAFHFKESSLDIDEILYKGINSIDKYMTDVLGKILSNSLYEELERAWSGLEFLIRRIPESRNVQVSVVNITKEQLHNDLNRSSFSGSKIYAIIDSKALRIAGSVPYTIILADYSFDNSIIDQETIKLTGEVAMASSAIFLSNCSPKFFDVEKFPLLDPRTVHKTFENRKYSCWNSMRSLISAKHIYLVIPNVLVQDPTCERYTCKEFVFSPKNERLLWGGGAWIIAVSFAVCFSERQNYSSFQHETVSVNCSKIQVTSKLQTSSTTTSWLIDQNTEANLSELGFITLLALANRSDRLRIGSLNSAFDSNRHSVVHMEEQLLLCHIGNCIRYVYRNRAIGLEGISKLTSYFKDWLERIFKSEAQNANQSHEVYTFRFDKIEVEIDVHYSFRYIVILWIAFGSSGKETLRPLRIRI